MLVVRSPSSAPVAGTETAVPNTTACISAKESAPAKAFSFRARGGDPPSQVKGDTALTMAEKMEPSMWP